MGGLIPKKMDTVSSWQSTFQGLLGDFGKIAADNLTKQTEDLNDRNNIAPSASARVFSPSNMPWIIGGAIGIVVLIVLLVKK